jgi:uncharacterized membrane protein
MIIYYPNAKKTLYLNILDFKISSHIIFLYQNHILIGQLIKNKVHIP